MKDIVCEKEVGKTSEFHVMFGDRPFYFCSKTCQTGFVNNPTRFIEKIGAAIGSTEGSPKINAAGETKSSRV